MQLKNEGYIHICFKGLTETAVAMNPGAVSTWLILANSLTSLSLHQHDNVWGTDLLFASGDSRHPTAPVLTVCVMGRQKQCPVYKFFL